MAETLEHLELKKEALEILESFGCDIMLDEYRVRAYRRDYIVDMVGFKGEESFAIECGDTLPEKIDELRKIFTQVVALYFNDYLGIRVSYETKKRWSQLIFTLVGENKKYRNTEELLVAMMDGLRESVKVTRILQR